MWHSCYNESRKIEGKRQINAEETRLGLNKTKNQREKALHKLNRNKQKCKWNQTHRKELIWQHVLNKVN